MRYITSNFQQDTFFFFFTFLSLLIGLWWIKLWFNNLFLSPSEAPLCFYWKLEMSCNITKMLLNSLSLSLSLWFRIHHQLLKTHLIVLLGPSVRRLLSSSRSMNYLSFYAFHFPHRVIILVQQCL